MKFSSINWATLTDPRATNAFRFTLKLFMVYASLFADMLVNNLWDSEIETNLPALLVKSVFQLVLVFLTVIAIYLMLTETVYLKFGLAFPLAKKLRSFLLITPIHCTLFLVVKAYRVAAKLTGVPYLALWTYGGFFPLYLCEKIAAAIYYLTVLSIAYRLGHTSWYTTQSLARLF